MQDLATCLDCGTPIPVLCPHCGHPVPVIPARERTTRLPERPAKLRDHDTAGLQRNASNKRPRCPGSGLRIGEAT